MSLDLLRAGLILAAALLIAALPAQAQSERSAGELMDAVMWNKEPIGGPFALTDHTGKSRTDADFRGKLRASCAWCSATLAEESGSRTHQRPANGLSRI
jgi:hypothetical protein